MRESDDTVYERALEYYRAKAMLLGMEYLRVYHVFRDGAAVHPYSRLHRLYHADTLEEVVEVPSKGLHWHINAGRLPPEVTNPTPPTPTPTPTPTEDNDG